MSEPARNRFALDLEDLERQLRGAATSPRPGQPNDPLAELTRIVGQDDPLKDLFAQRSEQPRAQAQPVPVAAPMRAQMRQEPAFAPAAPVPDARPPAELRGALDEFEALLRRSEPAQPRQHPSEAELAAREYQAPEPDYYHEPEPQAYHSPAPVEGAPHAPRDLDEDAGHYAYAYGEPEAQAAHGQAFAHEPTFDSEEGPDLEPRRSRKGLWTAAALLGVAVIGVGAAMGLRSTGSSDSNGLPLVISADTGPTKVEPTNPGGTEIPNQNKQIYERSPSAQQGPSKVVSSDEQPIDVQQAARSMPSRVVLAGPGSAAVTGGEGTTSPLAQAPVAPTTIQGALEPVLTPVPAVPGLGEPRRVRTVSIRPDGTPAGVAASGGGVANPAAPLVTGSAPARAVQAPAPTAQPAEPARRPEPAKVQERAATPANAPTPPVRVANAAPAAPANAAPATAALRSGTGDFTVQLAAPGSEAEARATFSALQRKYPDQLRGQTPIVRKTDLAGGKTVFRLRVGPYSREDATTMCTQLQSAGGQCFISKN